MRSRLARFALSTVLLGSLLMAGSAYAVQKGVTIQISAAQEVPTNGSTATAVGTINIDTNANTLSFNIVETGVVNESAAHIHGPASPGVNAGVLFGLPAGSPKVGVWNYPEAQEGNILSGQMYVNIHTSANPGGEIRGQITGFPNVPSVSPWSITALVALLVSGGIFFIRRRRSAESA